MQFIFYDLMHRDHSVSFFQLTMRLFDAFPYLFLFSTFIACILSHVLKWSLDTKQTLISHSHALGIAFINCHNDVFVLSFVFSMQSYFLSLYVLFCFVLIPSILLSFFNFNHSHTTGESFMQTVKSFSIPIEVISAPFSPSRWCHHRHMQQARNVSHRHKHNHPT